MSGDDATTAEETESAEVAELPEAETASGDDA